MPPSRNPVSDWVPKESVMSVVRRHIADGAVSPNKVSDAVFRDGSYIKWELGTYCPSQAAFTTAGGIGTAPSGSDNEQFVVKFKDGDALVKYIGTATQVSFPFAYATGLNLKLDATQHEGVHITFPPAQQFAGTTHEGYFIRAKVNVATKANLHDLAVGFVDTGLADTDVIANYDYFYALDIITAGHIYTKTEEAGAGVTSTDLAVDVTDGTAVELKVIFLDGVVRFYRNGVEVGSRVTVAAAAQAKTFTPFITCIQETGGSDVFVEELEVGPLSAVDDRYAGIL
jgi:hypothetical protein